MVKPDAMMMDGAIGCRSSRLVTSFENCCAVVVGWMHWTRYVGSSSWVSYILVVVLMFGTGRGKSHVVFVLATISDIYNAIVPMLLKFLPTRYAA